jgi:retron-type reverse transcriptase
MNRRSASGVDKESWSKYYEEREGRIPSLLASYKSNSYKAPKVRRTYIPKEDGKQRPLRITTIEDKVLQTRLADLVILLNQKLRGHYNYY